VPATSKSVILESIESPLSRCWPSSLVSYRRTKKISLDRGSTGKAPEAGLGGYGGFVR
jgi:hypothetical protein